MTLPDPYLQQTFRGLNLSHHSVLQGSPPQEGTLSSSSPREIPGQAQPPGTIEQAHSEGGKPFPSHPLPVASVKEAASLGFHVGAVTYPNCATSDDDVLFPLRPRPALKHPADLILAKRQPSKWVTVPAQRAWRGMGLEILGLR